MKLHSQITIRYYKKALMAVCLCIGVFAGGGAFCEPVENDFSQNSCENGFECFDDFIVYLKDSREPVASDEHGTGRKDRILLCSFIVELNQGMGLSKERIEYRKIIYKTLKELSGLPENKNELKEVIKVRFNNFMGAEAIKKVYLVKFVLW